MSDTSRDIKVQPTAQSFNTNFVDERSIKYLSGAEHKSNWANTDMPTNFSRVEPVATATNFRDSINFLMHLYRVYGGSVRSEELKKFVDSFNDKMIKIQFPVSTQTFGSLVQVDCFSCPSCFGILNEPITIQCGHSYCKKCLQKETYGQNCKRCKYTFTCSDLDHTKVNVLLVSLVEKWWPTNLETVSLRNEGNSLFEKKKGNEAFLKYSQAIELSPDDHLSFGNRSHVLLTLGKSQEALADAEAAIKICPLWTKGYFRKAVTLGTLGRYEEAFIALTICMYLVRATKLNDESALNPVKNEMTKVLHKIFLKAAGGIGLGNAAIRRHSFDPLQCSPYPIVSKYSKKHKRCRPVRNGGLSECEYLSSEDDSSEERTGELPGKTVLRNIVSDNMSGKSLQTKNEVHVGALSSGVDHQTFRIHRLFDRAIQDFNRIQNEVNETRSKFNPSIVPEGARATIFRSVNTSLISTSDFECTLCYQLFHQPVTTFCGHTYCQSCLERCLDHSPTCPLCKTSLQNYLAHRRHSVTQFVEVAISNFLPKEYTDRIGQHLEEITEVPSAGKNPEAEIPIFVCTMAFPTVPCPLHVFEPRYRLMIRRCMETGNRRFGMCCYLQNGANNYADFGTLLKIRDVQYFADGRSVVDTVGARRFKVLRKSLKDGYNTACIELLEDRPVEEGNQQRVRLLHDKVYQEASDWLQSVNQVLRQRIHAHFGAMPSPDECMFVNPDGPAWTWWLLAILPLDTNAQLAILKMNCLEKRLDSIHKVLRYVRTAQV